MGRSVICNYQVQVVNPITQGHHCLGVMKYKEALVGLLEEAQRIDSRVGYVWPQTGIARRKLNHIPWVTNHKGIDFLEIRIDKNARNYKRYTISGRNVGDKD